MNTPWVTEDEEGPTDAQVMLQRDVAVSLPTHLTDDLGKQLVKPEYKTKAYLVLDGSDKSDWGIIEDTLSDLLWQPGKGEIVGTWSRTKYDNLIHISLCTAIDALQDRSIQTFAKYAEERKQKEQGVKVPARRTKKAGGPAQEDVVVSELSVDEKLRFNSLRARLGRAK